MIEKEKRKRRTKAEIEAANPAGETLIKRTNKTTEEVSKNEEQASKAPEEHAAKPTKQPAERSVLIMACLEPEVSKKAIDAAKEKGVEVVILEDRVIHDYLSVRGKDEEKRDLGEFLNNSSNRLHAEDQCVKLWMILTGGASIEIADELTFTRTEVVKKTNLTHSKAAQVLQLLHAFGMLTFVKGRHEFTLNFSKNKCHDTIKAEVLAMCKALNNDILRYKASIEADNELTKEQKDDLYKTLQSAVDSTIEF
jgi:hypothetical protein